MSNSFFQKINPFGDNSSQRQDNAAAAASTGGQAEGETSKPNHKLEVTPNLSSMSKRKSASNLLHFNIANPFKSLHSSQQQQQNNPSTPQTPDHQSGKGSQVTAGSPGGKVRSSAGALEPVLQQLSKMRLEQQQRHQVVAGSTSTSTTATTTTTTMTEPTTGSGQSEQQAGASGGLLQVQQAHLSSSHHNLFTSKPVECCSGCSITSSQLNSPSTSNASTALLATSNEKSSSVTSIGGTNFGVGGSASVSQSPMNGPNHRAYNQHHHHHHHHHHHQASTSARTSARTSAHDLHLAGISNASVDDATTGSHLQNNGNSNHSHHKHHHHNHHAHHHNHHHNHHSHHITGASHNQQHHHHHHHNDNSNKHHLLHNHHHNQGQNLHETPATSHAFISMDWIQLNGEPPCGVCRKPLKSQSAAISGVVQLQQQQHQHQSNSPQSHYQLAQNAPFMCKTCKLQVHAQCRTLALADCMSRIAESSRAAAERQESLVANRRADNDRTTQAQATTTTSTMQSNATNSNSNNNNDNNASSNSVSSMSPQMSPTGNDNNNSSSGGAAEERSGIQSTNSNVSRDNIRLHRLAPSVKHVKRPDATKPIIEGWLKHTTLSDEQAKRHYWRLDDTDITLYENDTSTRYFKAIALNKITRIISASSLPKRVKEDVLLTGAQEVKSGKTTSGSRNDKFQSTTTTTAQGRSHSNDSKDTNRQQQSSMVTSANAAAATGTNTTMDSSKSADASPTKMGRNLTSGGGCGDLKDQMSAMFAFELNTGSVYLVQANSEIEASKWRGSLANIMANLTKSNTGASGQSNSIDVVVDKNLSSSSSGREQKQQQQQQQQKQVAADCVKLADAAAATVSEAGQPEVQSEKQRQLFNETQGQSPEVGAVTASTEDSRNDISKVSSTTTRSTTITTKEEANRKLPEAITTAAAANSNQHQQQQPPTNSQKTPTKTNQRHNHHLHHTQQQLQQAGHHYRGQHKTYTDPNRSRLYNRPRIQITLKPMDVPDHWIEGKYLIERDRVKGVGFEELGSGQFGKVYAAISEIKNEDPSKGLWSGVPVAIKEISKARFDLRQQAKLKNEANILSRLDHPGVIILERVHDLPDKIYIVMEQLEDDMLEMIVSTEEKRLNERITKFLTYQILEALKYLHSQHIAHCDLKPENVLLVERRSQFPQIKLCDFGFAKIIEENSFRCSLVGTPAYLAPEVVKGEKYNRSVDLWSVGVIVYVSLSGEFPFNEGENIHDQISRANFMYPDQPWAKISTQAKNFINSLLRVNSEKRLAANKAQMNVWLQSFQLWCDLSELEARVGKRWVTDDADFEHWSRYAREKGLQIPRSAIQLHEDLIAD